MKETLLVFDDTHSRAYWWEYTKYILFENHVKYRGLDDTREITINKNVYIKFILLQDITTEIRGRHDAEKILIHKGISQKVFNDILERITSK